MQQKQRVENEAVVRKARTASPWPLRELAEEAFSRAGGARLVEGNRVRLLRDAAENYPAWHDAIRAARRHVHFESYFIVEDGCGRELAELLAAKAREGVTVRVLYDWIGAFRKASGRFWSGLREAGVEVRAYNPPRFDSPLGWLSRDHRKMLAVDGEVGFVTGLCVGDAWTGDPARGIEPWRDTGVEIRGPAVAELEEAFSRTWAASGPPLPEGTLGEPPPVAGEMAVRIVASEPATAGMLRVDQLVAALAHERLWLTDAYYAGSPSYVQALRAAAQAGVDVRLLVPSSTDIPIMRPISLAGYRPLLEAGVRVFEWNGIMLHSKTAVADGRWARVGSTNLNVASWLGNYELDAVVEDAEFGATMEQAYLDDLAHATEVVLTRPHGRRSHDGPRRPHAHDSLRRLRPHVGHSGSASRAAAGAVRIGHVIGAAVGDRRVLGPIEAQLGLAAGLALCGLAVLFALVPEALAWPFAALGAWAGIALLVRGWRMRREHRG